MVVSQGVLQAGTSRCLTWSVGVVSRGVFPQLPASPGMGVVKTSGVFTDPKLDTIPRKEDVLPQSFCWAQVRVHTWRGESFVSADTSARCSRRFPVSGSMSVSRSPPDISSSVSGSVSDPDPSRVLQSTRCRDAISGCHRPEYAQRRTTSGFAFLNDFSAIEPPRGSCLFGIVRSNRRRVKNPRALCPPKILLLLRKFARFACNCAATTVTRTTSFELQLFWMRSSQIGIPRRRKDRQTVASDADVGW